MVWKRKLKLEEKYKLLGQLFTCGTCKGKGQVMRVTNTILGRMQSASTCPKCNGSGQIISNRPSGSDANGMVDTRRNSID